MTELDSLLSDPGVEIVDSTAVFSEAQAEAVSAGANRASAGVVRHDGRVLLMRRDAGWRLPGTDVGEVQAFATRLREALRDRVGITSARLTPLRVHRHAAADRQSLPPYHYVVFAVEPREPPPGELSESPVPDLELGWFRERPGQAINPDVLDRVFGTGPRE